MVISTQTPLMVISTQTPLMVISTQTPLMVISTQTPPSRQPEPSASFFSQLARLPHDCIKSPLGCFHEKPQTDDMPGCAALPPGVLLHVRLAGDVGQPAVARAGGAGGRLEAGGGGGPGPAGQPAQCLPGVRGRPGDNCGSAGDQGHPDMMNVETVMAR